MAKPPYIELGQGPKAERLTILHEDRSVIAIDKPRGWMLVPFTWQKTERNLQAAIQSSIGSGAFWARSRQLKFLRYVHRLDAETTGVLLFARSAGATQSLGALFESRQMHKRYLAVVRGVPKRAEWNCTLKLGKDPDRLGRVRVDPHEGKPAETLFKVLQTRGDLTLLEALPVTGRTHQIRVHLAAADLPVYGDDIYGGPARLPLALRSVELSYRDPFTGRPVRITAPEEEFLAQYGFAKAQTPPPVPSPVPALAPEDAPVQFQPRPQPRPPAHGPAPRDRRGPAHHRGSAQKRDRAG